MSVQNNETSAILLQKKEGMVLNQTKKLSSTQINFLVDLIALVVFALLAAPQATAIPFHEWISFVFAPVFAIHILLHWKWIVETTQRIFKKLPGDTRFNYVWDIIIYLMMIFAFVSGVVISEVALPFIGVPIKVDPFWISLHDASSNLLLIMLGIHLAMHWDWIVGVIKRGFNRQTKEA
ncbi:MAG: cytochrome b/b6 domain-containing protein [Chloroflexi bacterium]|nr:cytochrome b/b6 domain-containing protein [Chloroflexota bacterium]MBI5350250.1 cytochrome b/b6 domain-containing protein [Chloroflexota bacterium]